MSTSQDRTTKSPRVAIHFVCATSNFTTSDTRFAGAPLIEEPHQHFARTKQHSHVGIVGCDCNGAGQAAGVLLPWVGLVRLVLVCPLENAGPDGALLLHLLLVHGVLECRTRVVEVNPQRVAWSDNRRCTHLKTNPVQCSPVEKERPAPTPATKIASVFVFPARTGRSGGVGRNSRLRRRRRVEAAERHLLLLCRDAPRLRSHPGADGRHVRLSTTANKCLVHTRLWGTTKAIWTVVLYLRSWKRLRRRLLLLLRTLLLPWHHAGLSRPHGARAASYCSERTF